jgi:hypothetical protein
MSLNGTKMEISHQYVVQCRYNTLNGITPSNTVKYKTAEYKAVVETGKTYIKEKGLTEFSVNFQGDQYFVALWTAHIIFEYGNPEPNLKAQCIEIIKEYSDNILSSEVSIEEQEWLKKHCINRA